MNAQICTSLKVVMLAVVLSVMHPGYFLFAQKKTTKVPSRQAKQATFPPLDIAAIERITGLKGKENNGEYKITIPQNDLAIMVDGFQIIPPMGLGTWTAFTPSPEGAMVMGDIVVTEMTLNACSRKL